MTLPNNMERIVNEPAPQKMGLTPHELVRRQVEELDYHVTDEDMANMKISAELPEEEEIEADEEAERLETDKAGTSYEVLD